MADGLLPDESSAPIDAAQLQQELSEAILKAEENLAGWKQAQADFENFRKRKEAESAEWITFGRQAGFVQILPVLDSLEQAIRHAPEINDEKYRNFKNGLDGMVKQIDEAMEKMNIKKMQAIGEKFDPAFHEAVKEVLGETEGIIAEEYQSGYLFDGKVLRPAQVAITKKQS